jgi:hypothetical protein
MTPSEAADPHHNVSVAEVGAPLRRAKAALVMLHGRGSTAADMLSLAEIFAQPDLAYLAPQATGRSWYPYSFLAPIARNEPFLSSALQMLDRVLGRLWTEVSGRNGLCCSGSRRAPASPSNTPHGTRCAMAD